MSEYCLRYEYGIMFRTVCDRRQHDSLRDVFSLCVGCDPQETLDDFPDPPEGEVAVHVIRSDPPNLWWNMPEYMEAVGEETCKSLQGGIASFREFEREVAPRKRSGISKSTSVKCKGEQTSTSAASLIEEEVARLKADERE